ncbi:MAG: hypothetical protein H6719_17990 [Sandaracinaceae bacterium]|nr:hypothetical protein [Sandaracinaceae bacterium]
MWKRSIAGALWLVACAEGPVPAKATSTRELSPPRPSPVELDALEQIEQIEQIEPTPTAPQAPPTAPAEPAPTSTSGSARSLSDAEVRAIVCRRPRPATPVPPQPGGRFRPNEVWEPTLVLLAACGTMLRVRGTVLYDACEPDTEIGDLATLGRIDRMRIPGSRRGVTPLERRWAERWRTHRPTACAGVTYVQPIDTRTSELLARRVHAMVVGSSALAHAWIYDDPTPLRIQEGHTP